MVSFGNASGPVRDVDLGILSPKGSLYVTRPTLTTYAGRREDLDVMCADLFETIRSGKVKVEIGGTYPLADAARAHRDLESRKTTGSLLLIP
jgi:NADPH2:quinone reductase